MSDYITRRCTPGPNKPSRASRSTRSRKVIQSMPPARLVRRAGVPGNNINNGTNGKTMNSMTVGMTARKPLQAHRQPCTVDTWSMRHGFKMSYYRPHATGTKVSTGLLAQTAIDETYTIQRVSQELRAQWPEDDNDLLRCDQHTTYPKAGYWGLQNHESRRGACRGNRHSSTDSRHE